MDHQGARRSRPAADTRRQPPWPSAAWPSPDDADGSNYGGRLADDRFGDGTGPQPVRSPSPGYGEYGTTRSGATGSGAQPVVSPGSSAHRVLDPGTGSGRLAGSGSGAAPVLSRGSGAQQVLATGPQQTLGTGPRHTLGTGPRQTLGTGPRHTLDTGPQQARTPARDFGPGPEQAEPPTGDFGPWHTPSQPFTGEDTYIFGAIGVAEHLDQADTAEQAATPGRRRDSRAGDSRTGGRRSAGGRPKRRLRSRVAWLATTAVVLAGAGFAGYKFLYEPRVNAPVPATLRLPTTAPGSPGFNKALGKWQHIGTRAEDPESLTIAGLYPPQFVLNGASYVRTAASLTKTCSLAVYGTNLQAALQAGHCTQVLRASYISGDGKMMGTVGVINLISTSAADKAGQATGPQEIIAPLTGKKGPTSKLGTGTGVVQAEVKGHYLILMWAEFTSLKSPSGAAQRAALEQFAGNLVTGSANINLSTRMLTGKA
jgi:hypothetical protein